MTITLTRDEAHNLLAALEELNRLSIGKDAICLPAEIDDAIELLEARLSAPEPEPVAWFIEGMYEDGTPSFIQVCGETDPEFYTPLYTAPPQPEPPCKTGSQCIGGKCPQCVVSEPVAWMNESDIGKTDWKVWAHGKPTATMPLYAAPLQRNV